MFMRVGVGMNPESGALNPRPQHSFHPTPAKRLSKANLLFLCTVSPGSPSSCTLIIDPAEPVGAPSCASLGMEGVGRWVGYGDGEGRGD